jgi:CRISPR system Cascade subunit CasB
MSTTDEVTGRTPAPMSSGARRLGDVGALVARRATVLQETRSRSGTVAMLAHLRASVGREPGADPRVWSVTVDGVPGDPHGDEASPEERAVYAALTLFAVHQQSRLTGMHQSGVGLGRAVARLDRARGGGDAERISPVRRRFDAVVTSDGVGEVVHHLRGLVTQLRSEGIGLDYGMLADDLEQFQRPGGADTVRRRWARQLHRLDPDAGAATDDAPTEPAVPTDPTTEEQQ